MQPLFDDDTRSRQTRAAQRPPRWWPIVVVLLASVAFTLLVARTPTVPAIGYARFVAAVDAGRVTSVTIHQDTGQIEGTRTDGTTFTTQGPPGGLPDVDVQRLIDHDVRRDYAATSTNWLGALLVYGLPVILIIGFLVLLSRRSQRQLTGMNAFGRSRARVHDASKPSTTLADVAGYEAVKGEIREVVDFFRQPERFQLIGARVPKGLLLVGPPGTGKTLFARAVAGEAGVPFLSINASEFLEMFVGIGAARVRDLFENARKTTPCIVFIDEIDAVGRKRGAGLGGGQDEREQTLNQLLAEMDGFEVSEGIVVLAATNRPDILDPALLRAGRFDRQVVIPLPTQAERRLILEIHARSKRLGHDVDLDLVARGTPGMSGADLANLVNDAALVAVRRGSDRICAADLDVARDRVLMGLRRTSLVLSPEEKSVIAHHEAGHAVLAEVLPNADPVHKVTILPTGLALGATQQMPTSERQLRQQGELEDELAVRLGGQAAEELAFGTVSTGAHDDLIGATELARRMVREWGMSEELGHLAWGSTGAVFLGEDLIQTRDYSDETARQIDEATERILDRQAQRARAVLDEHRAALDAVAAALIEHETLDGAEVAALVGLEQPAEPERVAPEPPMIDVPLGRARS
jgi:cell division protease FtsH